MMKSNKEVTLKTRKTNFLQKTSNLKFAKNVFQKLVSKKLLELLSFLGKSHCAEKTKVASYRRNNKLGVSFRKCYNESKLSFLRTSLCFYSALAVLEPQIFVVLEQFGAENISLLIGRLVHNFTQMTIL